MTTLGVGAPFDGVQHWHCIDWARCHHEVKRLQTRIVKAIKDGRWSKVKALQWLLTHSFSGKALAVKRVTENQGKKTPGVDGETWSTPADKLEATKQLSRRNYCPLPLRRVYIPKSNNKLRPLGIPTMKDRAMQALYALALEPVAETTADPHSYGFRPQRCTADAIQHCFIALAPHGRAQWILEGDIKSCFDNISHDWLLANIPMDKAMLRKWLKAGYIDSGKLFPTEAGTPQGGIISPILANMTLDGLQATVDQISLSTARRGLVAKLNMVRYADDFIVTGASKEILQDEILPAIETFFEKRGLKLSKEKTRITRIEDGFDFLGQNLRKYNGKLLIKPSKKNIKTFLNKVRGLINGNPTARQVDLIKQLTPVIRGWARYHRYIVAKEIFNHVDAAIWNTLWRWAKRRHPNKGRTWIRKKYFWTIGGRSWVFAAYSGHTKDGRMKFDQLPYAADEPIKRYTKVRSEANPFDPAWEPYFEERLGVKMKDNLADRRKLVHLWLDQDGTCPMCEQAITKETGWHLHHITQRVNGGGDQPENLVLLHPNCHRKVHSQEIPVKKPARPGKAGFVEA
jgi:RNA-directed DNA polymerase